MDDISHKIALLRSEVDHSKRNALALELAESGRGEVLLAIVELIQRPSLVNHRGTLVYCLKFFNCASCFKLLADLQIAGNWEVAHEANKILYEIEVVSGSDVEEAYKELTLRLQDGNLEDWRRNQIIGILEMFE